MRTTASRLAAALLAATMLVPAQAASESFYFRAKAMAIPPIVRELALTPSAGPSVSVAENGRWDISFSATGGTGPYAFEATPVGAGALATISREVTGDRVSFSGTSPGGSYSLQVTVTDASGATASARVAVEVAGPRSGSAERPIAVRGGSVVRAYPRQPDWAVLYDDNQDSYINPNGNYVEIEFAAPVTFDTVYGHTPASNSRVEIFDAGSWVSIQSDFYNRPSVKLPRPYTASKLRMYGSGRVAGLRVGMSAATPPQLAAGVTASLAPGATSIPVSRFESRSPYNPGAISLASTPTSQNGVELAVTDSEVKVLSRPGYTTDIVVVARAEDGQWGYIPYRIQDANPAFEVTRATSISGNGIVRAYPQQPDWNVLYDSSSETYINPNGNYVEMTFAKPATFDTVFGSSPASNSRVEVFEDGEWQSFNSDFYNRPSVKLPRLYTASKVRMVGSGRVTDFRVGSSGPALPPAVSASRARNLDTPVRAGDFTVANPYQAGAISLAKTPPSQNGVELAVSDGEVRVVSGPDHNVDVSIVAETDGILSFNKFQYVRTAGQPSRIPSTAAVTAGAVTKFYPQQPDWHALYDGNGDSYVNPVGSIVELTFPKPVTFDRVSGSSPASNSRLEVWEAGQWTPFNSDFYNRPLVALPRLVTTDKVRMVGSGRVAEFSVGALGLATPPQVRVGVEKVLSPERPSVSVGAFESLSPYVPGAISLARTPASQSGVQLAVTAGEVRVVSGPDRNVDVAIVATAADGSASWTVFQYQAVPGQASVTPEPVALGAGSVVKANPAQPDWNVLYDNNGSTYVNPLNGVVQLDFATPVVFDTVYGSSPASNSRVEVWEDGAWVPIASDFYNRPSAKLPRVFVSSKVRMVGSGRVTEFRVGNAPSRALP